MGTYTRIKTLLWKALHITITARKWVYQQIRTIVTSTLSLLVGLLIPAFIGGLITVWFFEPYQECVVAERLYLSSLQSTAYEVQNNKQLLENIASTLKNFNTDPKKPDHKNQNLITISTTQKMDLLRHQPLLQYYDELTPELQFMYENPSTYVTPVYDSYATVNKHIDILLNTTIASLGFYGYIYAPYLPDAHASTTEAYQEATVRTNTISFSDLERDTPVCGDWFQYTTDRLKSFLPF